MLRDLIEEFPQEILRIPRNLHPFAEALRLLGRPGRHDSIPVDWFLRRGDPDVQRIRQRLLDQVRRLARGPQRFEMAEGLRDPVADLAVGLQDGDMRPSRNESCVEHRRPLAIVLMVRHDALRRVFGLTVRVDRRALQADDERQSAGRRHGGFDAVEGHGVVSVADDDGDAATGDGGFLGWEFGLREMLGPFAVVGTVRFLWHGGAHDLGDLLGQ